MVALKLEKAEASLLLLAEGVTTSSVVSSMCLLTASSRYSLSRNRGMLELMEEDSVAERDGGDELVMADHEHNTRSAVFATRTCCLCLQRSVDPLLLLIQHGRFWRG